MWVCDKSNANICSDNESSTIKTHTNARVKIFQFIYFIRSAGICAYFSFRFPTFGIQKEFFFHSYYNKCGLAWINVNKVWAVWIVNDSREIGYVLWVVQKVKMRRKNSFLILWCDAFLTVFIIVVVVVCWPKRKFLTTHKI